MYTTLDCDANLRGVGDFSVAALVLSAPKLKARPGRSRILASNNVDARLLRRNILKRGGDHPFFLLQEALVHLRGHHFAVNDSKHIAKRGQFLRYYRPPTTPLSPRLALSNPKYVVNTTTRVHHHTILPITLRQDRWAWALFSLLPIYHMNQGDLTGEPVAELESGVAGTVAAVPPGAHPDPALHRGREGERAARAAARDCQRFPPPRGWQRGRGGVGRDGVPLVLKRARGHACMLH